MLTRSIRPPVSPLDSRPPQTVDEGQCDAACCGLGALCRACLRGEDLSAVAPGGGAGAARPVRVADGGGAPHAAGLVELASWAMDRTLRAAPAAPEPATPVAVVATPVPTAEMLPIPSAPPVDAAALKGAESRDEELLRASIDASAPSASSAAAAAAEGPARAVAGIALAGLRRAAGWGGATNPPEPSAPPAEEEHALLYTDV